MLPDVQVVDTALRSVFVRTPLTPEVARSLPPQLLDGFVLVFGPRLFENGVLALGAFQPRTPLAEAAAEHSPGTALTPVEPYMMLGGSVPDSIARDLGIDLDNASPDEMHRALKALVAGWSPHIVGLVDRAATEEIFVTGMRRLTISEPWVPRRATLGGDAIHAMPPSLGAGANLALWDARVLADELDGVAASGEGLVDAVGRYERRMREYDFPILQRASTQAGAASGFTPAGMLRLIRLVGVRQILGAARRRDDAL